MTDEDLQAIEERWKKATPGPWGTTYGHKRASICQVYTGEYFDHKVIYQDYDTSHFYPIKDDWQGNIQAIANAPGDISALLAEVRRLQAAEKVCELLCQNAGMHCSAMGKCAECGKETVHALGLVCKSCIDKALRKWADGRNGNG